VLGAGTAAEVAERSGLPAAAAQRCLARLESAGLAGRDGARWRFRAERLAAAARGTGAGLASAGGAAEAGPGVGPAGGPAADPARSAVLRAFLRDGRLSAIPAARRKRLAVLDLLAGRFEIGVRYPERQVNDLLRPAHPDVAALRRYLVDEGFLTRDRGVYWRSGGSTDVSADPSTAG
jgi:hypothetical protein